MIWVESDHSHPSVTLAKQHIAERERVEAMREREPEPDLKAAITELAEIVSLLCGCVAVQSTNLEDVGIFTDMRNRAHAIARSVS